MPDKKLFAKSFLLCWNAAASCQTGNLSQRVSYSAETLRLHARQETFRKGFPARHNATGPSFPQETLGIRFPARHDTTGASFQQETMGKEFPALLKCRCFTADLTKTTEHLDFFENVECNNIRGVKIRLWIKGAYRRKQRILALLRTTKTVPALSSIRMRTEYLIFWTKMSSSLKWLNMQIKASQLLPAVSWS